MRLITTFTQLAVLGLRQFFEGQGSPCVHLALFLGHHLFSRGCRSLRTLRKVNRAQDVDSIPSGVPEITTDFLPLRQQGWPFTRKTGPPPSYTIGKVFVQNVLILVSCASVWQTEARPTILWRNFSFKLCYEMVSCASVWQTEARLSHLDVFGGFLMGWNRLKQYGCASAQTIVFFMEGAPSTLHTILRGRGIASIKLKMMNMKKTGKNRRQSNMMMM